MNTIIPTLSFLLTMTPMGIWAISGTGHSVFPLERNDRLIGIEATGITSEGGGYGLQGRYTHKTSRRMIIDAGLGTSGGAWSGRIFANAEYEIYPDYLRQPRFALRLGLEHSDEYSERKNQLALSPTISKGFSVWGREIFPFLSAPTGISLERSSKTYESFVNLSTGITGKLPFEGYQHLIGTLEGTMNVQNSYTGLFLGISYPMR